jgi:hypothetical protein
MAPKAPITPTSCPLCPFEAKRITVVNEHVKEAHQMNPQDAYDRVHGRPTCLCGCGKETSFINLKRGYSSMLKGHNGSIYAIYDEAKAKEVSEKRIAKLVGQESWAKGLTKETDERIRLRGEGTSRGLSKAYSEGKIQVWSKGLTKETDDRVRTFATEQKQRFASGELRPWAEGLSKKNDERIAQMALKVSMKLRSAHIRTRLDAQKRLAVGDIKQRIEANDGIVVVGDLSDYESDKVPNIRVRCTKCNEEWFSSLRVLQWGRCRTCDPTGSRQQGDVMRFIKELGVNVLKEDRSIIQGNKRMAELDIYVPQARFAVEYNGLYWHSSLCKSDVYHDRKSQQCAQAGVLLMHVFSDEWNDRPDIVKSMIRHRLGLPARKVDARKCNIIPLPDFEKTMFFKQNHIDGDVRSKVAFALTIDFEVVAAISLRQPFQRKKYGPDVIEVARICTLKNTSVRGGIGRLTAEARRWAKDNGFASMMSYVDTRHGITDGWKMSGWTLSDETPPRWWWTDFTQRFNRFKFKADRANGLTEVQVADQAGVVKIHGCRNHVYTLNV